MREAALFAVLVGGVVAAGAYAGGIRSPFGNAKASAITPAAVPVGADSAAGAVVSRYRLDGAPSWEVTLPDALMEISGIAFTPDGRLFAHGDEDATVWELKPRSGEVIKSFTLAPTGADAERKGKGKKKGNGKNRRQDAGARSDVAVGDFEDIVIVGDRFFLITSVGALYEFKEGSDGARVPATVHRTGLEESCEIEGMTYDAPGRALLLLCKENLPKKSAPNQVVVRAWSLDEGRLEAEPRLAVDYAALGATGAKEFNGSALAVAPEGRSLVLVAGPQRSFAEISTDARVVTAGSLDRNVHRQPEGLAFAPDGTLLIANEGAGGSPIIAGYVPATSGR